jgi:uncharacterized protein YggE
MKRTAFIGILSIYAFFGGIHCYAEDFEDLSKMRVGGEASVFKPADQMEVSLGVVTADDGSDKALEINKDHIRQILTNLKTLGLDENDYQTGTFHIKPIYHKPSKNSQEPALGNISHYEALSTIQIKTQKISLADQIIKVAVEGGANQITQVNFNLHNPQAYRGEAIKMATENALSDAKALAEAAGVRLKRILELSLDHWVQNPRPHVYKAGRRAASTGAMELTDEKFSFEPGQTEIHVAVNATIELD